MNVSGGCKARWCRISALSHYKEPYAIMNKEQILAAIAAFTPEQSSVLTDDLIDIGLAVDARIRAAVKETGPVANTLMAVDALKYSSMKEKPWMLICVDNVNKEIHTYSNQDPLIREGIIGALYQKMKS